VREAIDDIEVGGDLDGQCIPQFRQPRWDYHPQRSPTAHLDGTTPCAERGLAMPRASKATASETVVAEGYEGHLEKLDGGYTVAFETYTADADMSPLFAGLPDDRCQCAHWGYVVAGKVTFNSASGEETFQAGDAYFVGPGHTPVIYAGTEVIEFSPTEELQRSLEVVTRNMQAAG
jgi:hypothetical protein